MMSELKIGFLPGDKSRINHHFKKKLFFFPNVFLSVYCWIRSLFYISSLLNSHYNSLLKDLYLLVSIFLIAEEVSWKELCNLRPQI